MPIIPQAESKLSDSCAAQVFSLLEKMPLVNYINCHRCAVSSAGDLPLNPCLLIAVGPSVIPCPGAAALARYLAPGTSKVSFIDLVTPLRLLLAACSHRFFRYGTISRMPVRGQRRYQPMHFAPSLTLYPDIQAIAESLDKIPHFVHIFTDHNPKCAAANHILRECKNHKAEATRQACASSSINPLRFSLAFQASGCP